MIWSHEWDGSPSRARTCDNSINSRMLYQLSYRGTRHGVAGQWRAYSKRIADCKPQMPNQSSIAVDRRIRGRGLAANVELLLYGATARAQRAHGLVAEWLRRGLQILVRGFDSLRGLQNLFFLLFSSGRVRLAAFALSKAPARIFPMARLATAHRPGELNLPHRYFSGYSSRRGRA